VTRSEGAAEVWIRASAYPDDLSLVDKVLGTSVLASLGEGAVAFFSNDAHPDHLQGRWLTAAFRDGMFYRYYHNNSDFLSSHLECSFAL